MERREASVLINAPASLVYSMVSDITRMGEWSPECYRCRWIRGATGPKVGARFRGWNRFRWLKWARTSEVTAAEPGHRFGFRTIPNVVANDSFDWEYQFEPSDGGTRVAEKYVVLKPPPFWIRMATALAGRPDDMTEAMEETLARLKKAAEAAAGRERRSAA
ncbi:MAG: SRPBCC family protein [Chloroflexi bacterium]|nr:SRPBCC family protein [Chloroflexota bacterium]